MSAPTSVAAAEASDLRTQLADLERRLAIIEEALSDGARRARAKEQYLEDNPDVRKAGLDALYHYENWGRSEGRKWPN